MLRPHSIVNQEFILLSAFFLLFLLSSPLLAQVSDDATEQREFLKTDRIDDATYHVIETANQIYQQIKKRAQEKIIERKRRFLRKTRITASIINGHETNPLSEPNNGGDEDGDWFINESIKLEWLPKFHKRLRMASSYRIYNKTYVTNNTLNYLSNSFKSSLKFYPLKGARIEPGIEYYNVHYFNDDRARYGQLEPFLEFKSYISGRWNAGGRYGYSYKRYHERLSRDSARADIADIERKDNRHTFNLYATRYLGNFSIRIRGRYLTNNSNDQYQNFYDFTSSRGYFTIAKKFLNDKIYTSFMPNFEKRKYDSRIASGTSVREDNIMTYNLNVYFEIIKNLDFHYSFYHQNSNSNSSSGEFKNIINSIGLTKKF